MEVATHRWPAGSLFPLRLLEQLSGGPLTLGAAIEAARKCEEPTQEACARKLGVSKSHLCDVEKAARR